MKNYFLIILLTFFGFNAFAQVDNQTINSYGMRIPVYKKTPEGFTGTPFVDEEFKKGQIIDENGRSQAAFLRYNAVEGIMEIKLDKQQEEVHVLPRISKISYFIDGFTYFLDSKRTDDGELLEGYFVHYFDGENVSLLGWPRPDVIEARAARTGYDKDKPAHLKIEMEYFLEIDNNRLKEVRLRPRDFRKAFDNNSAMKNFLSKNKVKDLETAIEALKFYEKNS